jgi:superfamily I DNA/RNA helicase
MKILNIFSDKDIYDYLQEPFDENKFKNKMTVRMEDIGFNNDVRWYDAFVNTDHTEEFYIRTMLSNGEKLSEEPRIEVSTIHAAKGGECKNVILVLDNARKIREATAENVDKQDEEHRVWYVGVTRSMENLYLFKSKKERYGYQL